MQVQDFSTPVVTEILEAAVLNAPVLARLSSVWDGELLDGTEANRLLGWCVSFYRLYGSAPGPKRILTKASAWAATQDNNAAVQLMDAVLSGLDLEQDVGLMNTAYLLDRATRHCDDVRLLRLAQQVTDAVRAGKGPDARALVTAAQGVEVSEQADVKWLEDDAEIDSLFVDANTTPLVTYPGPVGQFFGDDLERAAFVAFMAPTGTGKTFLLLDLAWQALEQRRKVAFFQVGDMTRKQFGRRLAARVSMYPFKSTNLDRSWPCKLRLPAKVTPGGKGEPPVMAYTFRDCPTPMTPEQVKSARDLFVSHVVKTKGTTFQLVVRPNLSITAQGVRDKVADWDRAGWRPDVVCVDYADNLRGVDSRAEARDQINQTWKLLRALAMEFDCLVATATQVKADAYKLKDGLIDLRHFADDRRKADHVSAMFTLNQRPAEKSAGVMRLHAPKRRDAETHGDRPVTVAGQLAVASPILVSSW